MFSPKDYLIIALFILGSIALLPGLAIALPVFGLALWLMDLSERD